MLLTDDHLSLIEAHLEQHGACPAEVSEAVQALRQEHHKVQETAQACATANANMAELYLELEEALDLVKEREAAAAEAHRTIRDMLQTMQQGLFAMGPDLAVDDQYSDYLETILGREDLAGQSLSNLLLQHAELTGDERSMILGTLGMSFGCPAFLFSVNDHVLPRELNRMTPDGVQILELDWSVIEDDKEDVAKVLVCVRDVTQLRKLQQEANEQREQLEIIGEIISNPQVAFERAIAECERLATYVAEDAGATLDLDTRLVLMRNLHTIKGIARNHGLKKLSDVVHHAEEAMGDDSGQEDVEASWVADTVHGAVQQYRAVNTHALGRQAHQVPLSDARRARARQIVEAAQRTALSMDAVTAHRQTLAELGNLLDTDLMELDEFCAPLRQCAARICEELGKPTMNVETTGQVWLQPGHVSVLSKAFVHLIRNAADHGIEPADERTTLGKPEHGTLFIHLTRDKSTIGLRVRDDGGGLDLDALRRKRSVDTDHEAAQAIFDDGLTTKEKATAVSGRGVGMSAVRDTVEDAGGSVWLELEEVKPSGRRGFCITISLPSQPATVGYPRRRPDAIERAPERRMEAR